MSGQVRDIMEVSGKRSDPPEVEVFREILLTGGPVVMMGLCEKEKDLRAGNTSFSSWST